LIAFPLSTHGLKSRVFISQTEINSIMWKVFLYCFVLNFYVFASLNISNHIFIDDYTLPENLLAFNGCSDNLSPIFLCNSINEPRKIRLMDDIKRSQSRAGWGTFIHFSGFIMCGISIPLMMSDIKYNNDSEKFPYLWLSLSLTGTALSLLGPIPSLAGANRIEDSMEDVYEDFYKHSYTGSYIKSVVFEGVAWMINILGTSLLKKDDSEAGPIIIDVLFYSLFISAEAFRAKSALGPVVYGKRAKEHMTKKAVKVNISPFIPSGGGLGFISHVSF